LKAAGDFGAQKTVRLERGGGQADKVRSRLDDPAGAAVVIEASGQPAVWSDALDLVRSGGLVNLFGGCAPGTAAALDTHKLHYGEITLKGVYHHRPATVREALELLADRSFEVERLLTAERPLGETEEALRSMIRKEALKVVIRPARGSLPARQ
jgi:L-iditol 2-dehydrogenase